MFINNYESEHKYDFKSEYERYNFNDIMLQDVTLNRGKCKVHISDNVEEHISELRNQIYNNFFPNTLSKNAPILDISKPYSGHYFYSYNGIYFDADIGVGQKLIDDQHPNIIKMLQTLIKANVLARRESVTNDIMISAPESGIKTPQDLAELITGVANKSFPKIAPYKAYFSSSGAEAIEAAIKIACRKAHQQIIKKYGYEFEKKIMNQLNITINNEFMHPVDKDPLYYNYPFFFIAMKGAFHGRTLGALSLTHVRPVHKRGYVLPNNVKHISFNGDISELINIIDSRSLNEIITSGDNISEIINSGCIPKELIAGVVLEAYQGEGGYIVANKKWISSISKVCHDNQIPLILDEVQTFARTGKVFVSEHFNIEPDIIAISKASVMGITLAPASYAEALPKGWHSNTWGGGKVFDNNLAWTVLDTYLNYHDPVFLGNTYQQNQFIKEKYINEMFNKIAERHSKIFLDYNGIGGMWGFTVRFRDEVCKEALNNGLKLLSCGVTKDPSAIRALFLADVLTKEIDDFGNLLDMTLSNFEKKNRL